MRFRRMPIIPLSSWITSLARALLLAYVIPPDDGHGEAFMLRQLALRPLKVSIPSVVPPLIAPLIQAAVRGEYLTAPLMSIVNALGFDNYTHGISLSTHPNAESHSYVFTTLPAEWIAIYDQKSYIEVDPRIEAGIRSTLPFVWDQKSLRGKSSRIDEFVVDATKYGLSSGVSLGIRDTHGRGGFAALTSSKRTLALAERNHISLHTSDIIALAQYFHELVVLAILDQNIPPLARGKALSKRERQCLVMAANGLTSNEIGLKLGITERTADFHFCNIITKLNVLNRKEAVARAVSLGIIHLES